MIDSLLSACHDNNIFNGVALVVDNGSIIHHKTYGYSDKDNKTEIKLNDRFYIGSLTKQFTSALIFILQEEGLLQIEDPIATYLPEFDTEEYKDITIHHLLTHTAGFNNYTSYADFDKSKDYSRAEFLEFNQRPLLFDPGSKWNYSNTGYYFLGIIAERVGKKDYGTLLQEKIFNPLQMTNSGFDTTWINERVAKGFYKTINGWEHMPSYSLSTLFSTGGVYATAEDLFKWDQALYTNQLLSDSSKVQLFEPIKNDYACGWYVKRGTYEDGEEYERHFHGGWIKGYHAFILRRIPPRQTVILLDNSYSQEIQTIKNRIWSALIEEEIRKIKPKFSNILYEACANKTLSELMDSVESHIDKYEHNYEIEEFDLNTVAYRLMESNRHEEAAILFDFNLKRFPESWNVYDSKGELELKLGQYKEAEELYSRSLALNPDNVSAKEALVKIAELLNENYPQKKRE